jgi:hypothetical protein
LLETIATPGQTGVIEEWLSSNGQHTIVTDLSPLTRSRVVFNGRTGWAVDERGKVHDLNPGQVQNQILSRYIDTYSYLLPNRIPGIVTSLGEDNTKTRYVLRLAPDGGRSALCYVDEKSFLPIKIELQIGNRTIITTFEDYRVVDGIKVPFSSRQFDIKNEQNQSLVRISDIRLNAPIDAAVFAKPVEVSYVRFEKGESARGIPFVYSSFCLPLLISVNGSPPALFILDSGAGGTVIDSDYAATLGLKGDGSINLIGSGANSQAGYLRNVTLGLPGVKFQIGTVLGTPLTELRKQSRLDIKGLLGGDFIRNFVVEIDYQTRTLSLFEPEYFNYSGKGKRLPIAVMGNTAVVTGAVGLTGREPIEGPFMIDTGADEAIYVTRVFNEVKKLTAGSQTTAANSAGIAAKSENLLLRLESFELGGFRLPGPTASVFVDSEGIAASNDLAGGVGMALLKRFKVVFDYSRKVVYLEPDSLFGERFTEDEDLSGLDLDLTGPDRKTILVRGVVENSPAANAGFMINDEIIQINSRPAAAFTIGEIESLFTRKGDEFSIKVKRNGKAVTARLILKQP